MIPPQSPELRLPTAWFEVNTIGSVTVPFAFIFPPRYTIMVTTVVLSPRITVPAGMVNVPPFAT